MRVSVKACGDALSVGIGLSHFTNAYEDASDFTETVTRTYVFVLKQSLTKRKEYKKNFFILHPFPCVNILTFSYHSPPMCPLIAQYTHFFISLPSYVYSHCTFQFPK